MLIRCRFDVDLHRGHHIDVIKNASPSLMSDLELLTDEPLVCPIKSANALPSLWCERINRPEPSGLTFRDLLAAARAAENRD